MKISSAQPISRAKAARRGARSKSALWVTPGSEQVHLTIERDGQLADLEAIGGTVLANACGPCIGQWKRDDVPEGEANSIISSYNRNFRRRNDGRAETLSFIASPEIVIAYALAGRLSFNPITDEIEADDGTRFILDPPAPAPEVPEPGFRGQPFRLRGAARGGIEVSR